MTFLRDVLALLDQTLEPARFSDYCPNGLQVEGRAQVNKIVTGVTASQALIDAAIVEQMPYWCTMVIFGRERMPGSPA